MMIIGLTGGFGTGKTTVAKMFKRLGAFTIDVDEISRRLSVPGEPLYQKYIALFGKEILLPSKQIDREKIASIVFSDQSRRKQLDSISHPCILEEMTRQINAAKKKHPSAIVVDLPLLFEDGLQKHFQRTLVVYAKQEKVFERIRKSRHMTFAQIRNRIASQKPLSEKKALADIVIDNNGVPGKTLRQVKRVYALLVH